MTSTQIETLFHEVIQEKAIYNKLEGITEIKYTIGENNEPHPPLAIC